MKLAAVLPLGLTRWVMLHPRLQLIEAGRLDDAIAILKQNVDPFPQSPKGDRANALANYEKALALEPQNVGAMEVLRRC
jgi:hypothetical protein